MAFVQVLSGFAIASLIAWLAILLLPWRPWDLQPVAEDEPEAPDPADWPSVCILVPARNEADYLEQTLPALLGQDYPGPWRIVLVDDRSEDGTGELARGLGGDRVTVLTGEPLPAGWVGKVWALEQAVARSGDPDFVLLTDADIRHAPESLRRLVAESVDGGLALDSRMARLRCETFAERLLLPPYLFFFNLLYPMRRANDHGDPLASAAGGCILLRREALDRAGGFAAIRGEVIDDLNLARRVKALPEPIRIAVSRSEVESVRRHPSIGSIWRMVRRTAFDELRYSWLRLAGTVLGLALLFLAPVLATLVAIVLGAGGTSVATGLVAALGLIGAAAWGLMAAIFSRTVRFLGLGLGWALTLPVGGTLYGAMTVDSAFRQVTGRNGW